MDKPTKTDIRDLIVRSHPRKAAKLILGASWQDAHRLIFEHPEPQRVMAALPVEDAYVLIKRIGETDALDLIELATDEQVQGVLDFECWRKDELNEKSAAHWFQIIMAVSDDNFERRIRALDFTFLVLFLKRRMLVERYEELWDGEVPAEPNIYMPPDRRHLITYLGKPKDVTDTHEFTQRIFRLDNEMYYKLLEAVYWESATNLEEWAYEDRAGRMQDRGFPDFFSAIEIFAPINPDRFQPAQKAAQARRAETATGEMDSIRYLQRYEHQDNFLRRVLALDFPERESVIVEIAAIVNMAAVAEQISFADAPALRTVVRATDGYLNIGLEYLSGADKDHAVGVLARYRLLDVYKIGRSLAHRLGVRAHKLLPRASADGKNERYLLIDPPDREFIAALLPREPRRAGEGDTMLPFESLDQVEAASARLADWERAVDLLGRVCSLTPESIASIPMLGLNHDNALALTYRTLFCTAYANDRLGRAFAPRPLKVEDVVALRSRFESGDPPRLSPDSEAEFLAWLDANEAASLWPIFAEMFAVLAQEIALTAQSRRPDVRYLSTLLVELPY